MVQKLFTTKCRDAMLASETIQNNCNHPDVGVPFSLRRRVRDEVQSHSSMRRRVRDEVKLGSCLSRYGVITLLIFILSVNFTNAQTRPTDSLYVWVNFTEDNILIDIPESYITYRTTFPPIPKHVRIREVNVSVPRLPGQATLITLLKKELLAYNNPQSKDDQLKYLGRIVLLLFYSHNDLASVPDESLKSLDAMIRDSQIRNEAGLVKKWIDLKKKKSAS